MADRLQLMMEADRRGILPPDKKVLLDEARRRGLVPNDQPQAMPAPMQPADTRAPLMDVALAAPAGGPGVAPQPKRAQPAIGIMSQFENVIRGSVQGTSPYLDERTPLGEVTAEDDGGGQYYDTAEGRQPVDYGKHTTLRDPATGRMMVFPKDDAKAEPGWKGAGRTLLQGLVVNPITGPATTAAVSLPKVPRAAMAADDAARAAQDVAAFDRAGVPLPPAAFSSAPVRGLAKSVAETPFVGAPVNNAIEDTYQGIANVAKATAERMGPAQTPREAGLTVQTAIERFKDARPVDVVEDTLKGNRALTSSVIKQPTSATSLKTKQAALYEKAWSLIPDEMQRGRAVTDTSRVMQSPSNTRAVVADIVGRNSRMTVQSGENAAGGTVLNPVQGGLLGKMIEAVSNKKWTANLQTLRDMRSEFRRLASGMSDTERNTLKLSDIERIQGGITKDMIALLQRNAARYREAGDVATAENFERSIRQFKVADTYTRLSMERLDTIEKLFKADTAEALSRNITNAALAGTKGNFDMLRTVQRVLHPDEFDSIKSMIVSELGRPVGSARGVVEKLGFSAESFLTRYNNMSDEAKGLLFGGQHKQAIDDLVAMSSRLANIESMANRSRSGANAVNVAGGLAGVASVTAGDVLTPLAVFGGGYGLSMVLSRPLYTRWASQYMNLKAAALAAPSKSVDTALTTHVNRLLMLAKEDAALLPVARAIAGEDGISEGQADEGNGGNGIQIPNRAKNGGEGQNGQFHERPSNSAPGGAQGMDFAPGGPEGDTLSDNPADRIPITADGNEAQAREQQAKGYAANRQRVKDRSLVTYGDQQVIPNNIDDAIDMLISGASKAGEVGAAFPGVGTLIDDAGAALGAGMKTLRSKPPVPQEIIPGASKEGDAILGAERAKREAAQAAQRRAREEVEQKARGAAYQAEAVKKGSTGTVPIARGVDAPSAQRDMAALKSGLPDGTAPMAIKGRQGMPTRDEQIDLVEKYIGTGGRLDDIPAGPWGRNPTDDAREAIQRTYDKTTGRRSTKNDRTTRMQDEPSVGMLADAYRAAKSEAAALREEIGRIKAASKDNVPKEEVDRLTGLLKETQMDLISLQKARAPRRPYRMPGDAAPIAERTDGPMFVPRRDPPRIYRKGQE